jgi:hypothetical protein
MAWDSSRPVPWQRLIREWLIYVAVMAVVLLVIFRSSNVIGAFAGLLVSGPLYLLMGFVLAKLGYQRKTLKQMRTPQTETRGSRKKKSKSGDDTDDGSTAEKSRPAPTKRTSGGGNRPRNSSRSKSRRR